MGKVRKSSFAKQRIRRGWADKDTWNIDSWFMKTMKPMLIYFRDNHMGYPSRLEDDSKWIEILNEMISFLEKMNSEDPNTLKNKYEKEYDLAWTDYMSKHDQFVKTSEGLYIHNSMSNYDEYKDICKKYHEEWEKISEEQVKCKDKFFELFSKYFWDLWD